MPIDNSGSIGVPGGAQRFAVISREISFQLLAISMDCIKVESRQNHLFRAPWNRDSLISASVQSHDIDVFVS